MQLLLALSLLSIASLTLADSVTTSGASGQLCGGVKCVTDVASCVNGDCECNNPPFVARDGEFFCYRKNQVWAEIRNDPKMTTFDGHSYDLRLPCRYLITHVEQHLKIAKKVAGKCTCYVHGWNKKFKGKFYAAGFDVACNITRTKGSNNNIGAAVRKEGFAENGVYQFREWGTEVFDVDGPWFETPVNIQSQDGIKIKCNYDSVNNFAVLDIKACGLKVALRPTDIKKGLNQIQPPGISVGVNCAHKPTFLSNDRVMATAPAEWNGVPFAQINTAGLNIADFFLFRALTSNVEQNQPDGSNECKLLATAAGQCNSAQDKITAIQRCAWLFRAPRFIRCVDPSNNADGFLRLLKRCVQAVCSNQVTCQNFVSDLIATGCTHVSGINTLNNYLNGAVC
ncbi:uncharacterized protein LOC101859013 [Aplysia californica]|uniref:Uncharacterized protein LOC101859013 n=1 Tax=Aplysia californica TaxID=6500 RepID=A0ABM0JP04_APLCA|nr:uncharacterized protein LOC101859013 [Aplysia californica]